MSAPDIAAAAAGLMLTLLAMAPSSERIRLTAEEVAARPSGAAGAGTSGIAGIRTTILSGDPSSSGPYVIALRVPANTRIAAHRHRDDRTATVVAGTWHFGYGAKADDRRSKALGPGGFYTEPGGVDHFARTGPELVTLHISGIGPTDTHYAEPIADPRH